MQAARPKVVYWNHSPTPYFVARFNALVEHGGIDFEAWFNTRREEIRSWEVDESRWRFRARYIPAAGRLLGGLRVPGAELREVRPDLLVQEYDRAHLMAGFLAARALGTRTAFRVLPNFDAWSERTWWREGSKRFAFRAVDAAKVPGSDGARLAARYGLPTERTFAVTQSISVDEFVAEAPGRRERGAEIRAELGLSGCVFLYAGRLWSGKGVDELLSAYGQLIGETRDVSLLLVGDGPDEARLRQRASGLPRVAFAGFQQADRIGDYYAAADAMVFPTHGDPNGLVVEEAMVAGLPVISSSAAGDIARRLPEGEAGFLVPVASQLELAERMRELAGDRDLRRRMGERGAALAVERHHGRYAEDFARFVSRALALPRRRGIAPLAATLGGSILLAVDRRHPPAPRVAG